MYQWKILLGCMACSPARVSIPGLDVATCGVANATRFYSLATNFSLLAPVARKMVNLTIC